MENPYTPTQSEPELIELAIAKDTSAFEQLMEKYEQQIYRVARNITKNHEDAEDVTQSTFFKAYAKLNQFQGNSKFSTWLTRIAVNESLMCLRKHKQNNTVSIDENLETENGSMRFDFAENKPNPEQAYAHSELRKALNKAIRELSPKLRSVFSLRNIEDLSAEETAKALSISTLTIKSRLLRTKLKLRPKLHHYYHVKGLS
jgi:RNA polymerase sigma-70 factor (ECF subfamily)